MRKFKSSVVLFVFAVVAVSAAGGVSFEPETAVAQTTGTSEVQYWSSPSTWGGRVPREGEVATIPAGKTVVLNTNTAPLKGLQIDGELIFANKDLELTSDWIMVHGKLQIGTETTPFTRRAKITLTGNAPDENIMGMGTKVLGVMGGTLDIHGQKKTSWTKLAGTVEPGATQMKVIGKPTWKPGDRIVVASSDFDPKQAEEVIVRSISGSDVTFAPSLKYRHWGTVQKYGSRTIDTRAEVGVLTRNVVIQGDDNSQVDSFGGHLMAMQGSTVRLEGAELRRMGQRDLSDKGILGRYPIHFHLVKDATGSYVRNNSIHHALNRFLVLHGTNNALVQNNVAYDTIGHGFMLEDGVETKNTFERNLGMLTRAPSNPLIESDLSPSVFWISNPDNTYRGNVAAGSEGLGFWYDLPSSPTGVSAGEDVFPRKIPIREFSGNTSHSNIRLGGERLGGMGMAVDAWEGDTNLDPEVQSFTSYKNNAVAFWTDQADIIGARFADSNLGVFSQVNGIVSITDALMIGLSNNSDPAVGIPAGDGAPMNAIQNYVGSVAVNGATFANYKDYTDSKNSKHLGGVIGVRDTREGNFPPQPTFQNVEMINSNVSGFRPYQESASASDPMDPKRTIIFRDLDGSLTGKSPLSSVVYNNPLQLTSGCERLNERSSVCPETNSYGMIEMSNFDRAKVQFRRGDGATNFVPVMSGITRATILANSEYQVTSSNSIPAALRIEQKNSQLGDWYILSIPYSYPQAFVYPESLGTQVPSTDSLSELKSYQGRSAYFFDNTNDRLYLKMRSTTEARTPLDTGGSLFYNRLNACSEYRCSK